MLVHNLTGNLTTPLNTFFLTKSEYIVLIERVRNSERIKKDVEVWVGNREQEIKELRKYVRQHKTQFKQKLEKFEKHFKIGRTSASPICLQLLGYYLEDYEQDQAARARNPIVRKRDDGKEIHSDDVIVVDDDLNVIHKTKINDTGREKPGHRLELHQQKTALVEEIQQLTRESNTKREVVLKLVGLLKAMDPVFLEAREKIEIARRKLLTLKRGITDDEAKRMIFMEIGLDGINFFDDGTKVNKDTHNSMLNGLKTENLQFSRDVSHRCQGYATEMARYRDMLREKIFAEKELFRKVHVGKKDKHEQEFHTMNKGIDADRLNQSDYITKKQDQDLPDYEVYLDGDVDQVLEPTDGAKETWEDMLKRIRGWDGNPFSKDDIDRKRGKHKGHDADDDEEGGRNSPDGGFGRDDGYSPNRNGNNYESPGGDDKGNNRYPGSPNDPYGQGSSPGGAADRPQNRDRNSNFDSFGGGGDNRGRGDYDSFGPDPNRRPGDSEKDGRNRGRDPDNYGGSRGRDGAIRDNDGQDPYSRDDRDRNGRNNPQDGGQRDPRDPRNRNPFASGGNRDNTFGDEDTADFKGNRPNGRDDGRNPGGSNYGSNDPYGRNGRGDFGSDRKDGNQAGGDGGRRRPFDPDGDYGNNQDIDPRTGRPFDAQGGRGRDSANQFSPNGGRIDPGSRRGYDGRSNDFDPRSPDNRYGSGPQSGDPNRDPRSGRNGGGDRDVRNGSNDRDGRNGYNDRDGRNGMNDRDGRNGYNDRDGRNGNNDRDGRSGQNDRDGRNGQIGDGRNPGLNDPRDNRRQGKGADGGSGQDRFGPNANDGNNQNNFDPSNGRDNPIRRDRYGNPIPSQKADTKYAPKGTRGYVNPYPGSNEDPDRNRRDDSPGGNRVPNERGSGGSRPATPTSGRDGNSRSPDGYPSSPSGGRSGNQPSNRLPPNQKPVDPNDPLSIAGLDYGKSGPKPSGSNTKNKDSSGTGGGPDGTSGRTPAEVHKATTGVGKGGAVRRNVVPGDAGSGGNKTNPGTGPGTGNDGRGGSQGSGVPGGSGGLPNQGNSASTIPQGSSGISPTSGNGGDKLGNGQNKDPADGDDIVIADDVVNPNNQELLPMDFDDDDEDDQPNSTSGKKKDPANKMTAGSGTVKPAARRVVPGQGPGEPAMDGDLDSNAGSRNTKDPSYPGQDGISNPGGQSAGKPSGQDYDPNSANGLKPVAPNGVDNAGDAGQTPPPPADYTPGNSGNTDPNQSKIPPPPGNLADLLKPDPNKKPSAGTNKGGNTLTIDPPDPSKARRKSVRPDGTSLPTTPPNDQEKLTTLEDLVNASDTVEFEEKLEKYAQSKGAG